MARTPQQIRELATTTHTRYSRSIRDIENDTTLSDTGKQQRLAKEYLDARRKISELRQELQGNTTSRLAAIEQELFGLPGGANSDKIMSWRDAEDRANSLTQLNDAEQLMHRALRGGDTILANAIAARAWSKAGNAFDEKLGKLDTGAAAWGERVLDPWMLNRPEAEDLLTEWISLSDSSTSTRVADDMTFNVSKPNLIGATNDFQLLELAATGATA